MFQSVGMTVDYLSTDWASLVQRRANKAPPDKGGWNCFPTSWPGLFAADPGNYPPLRGNGPDAYVGWPTDPKMEDLREEWFNATDLAAEQRIGQQMQILAMQNVPFYPLGQRLQPTAHRTDLADFVRAGNPSAFWSVRRI
jgi:peptide/nickel transport system substrate-binding protein